MNLQDTPIKKQDEDRLNRKGFAKKIGNTILRAQVTDGICIAIMGPWGSGKTSIINMILEEIETQSKGEKYAPAIIIFNPWNFTSADQLTKQFLGLLAQKFSTFLDRGAYKISKEFDAYSSLLEEHIPFGKWIKRLLRFLTALVVKKSVLNDSDIFEQKNKLTRKLRKQKRKIFVVIDDIDRLPDDEIRQVFRLVTSVARFPQIVYLLSFDREIIANALNSVQKCDGDVYLEKIIQVPIALPDISKNQIKEVMFDTLNKILEVNGDVRVENDYWEQISACVIQNHLNNMRDVVRLENSVCTKCCLIGSETDLVDLMAITAIELKSPKVYQWIKEHKGDLVGDGGLYHYPGMVSSEVVELIKNSLKEIEPTKYEEIYNELKILFPYMNVRDGYGIYDSSELRRKKRIGDEDSFDRYFNYELAKSAISKSEFERAVNILNEEELVKYINEMKNQDRLISFLKDLFAMAGEMSSQRMITMFGALFAVSGTFDNDNSTLDYSTLARVEDIILNLIRRLPAEARCNALAKEFERASINSIPMLSKLFYYFIVEDDNINNDPKRTHERNANKPMLDICKQLYFRYVIPIILSNNILDLRREKYVLALFERLAPEQYRDYMDNLFKEKINQVKYLTSSAERWTGMGAEWRYNDEYKTLLSRDMALSALDECIVDGSLWRLDNEKQHRAVAYLIWETRGDGDDVEDEDVNKKIQELKMQGKE